MVQVAANQAGQAPEMGGADDPVKVFVSYAHADEAHRATLGKHLKPLEREGLIQIWHDRQITGGREWAGEIDAALRSAEIVLLLVSPDFVNSDYCNDVELAEAMQRHAAQQLRVVPVILRSCDWEKQPFARFNALPPEGEPAVEAAHPDQSFKAIALGLRSIVAELRGVAVTEKTLLAGSPGTAAPPTPPKSPRILKIAKISLFGVEFGPFEIPLPSGSLASHWKALLLLLLLLVVVGGGGGAYVLRGPVAEARNALRVARYDTALASLRTLPDWLSVWPAIDKLRQTAALGEGFQNDPPDWEVLGAALERLRARWPDDANLMVLDATYQWRQEKDAAAARRLARAATEADAKNAEAWFLLGQDAEMTGDAAQAEAHYRTATQATRKAKDSPQYRNNLARLLLDSRRFDEAITEYRKIDGFPLARVEQALAHWAKGETDLARSAQHDAVTMLKDVALMQGYNNHRAWVFYPVFYLDQGVQLASPDDKRCYAQLGEAASRKLGGEKDAAFPPGECGDAPVEIRWVVADDLCRFVDPEQPALVAVARQLRESLRQPVDCPAPAASVSPRVES